MTREEVIQLILKMNKFNQREQAKVTYLRENALHPEWDLFCGIREAMGAQQ